MNVFELMRAHNFRLPIDLGEGRYAGVCFARQQVRTKTGPIGRVWQGPAGHFQERRHDIRQLDESGFALTGPLAPKAGNEQRHADKRVIWRAAALEHKAVMPHVGAVAGTIHQHVVGMPPAGKRRQKAAYLAVDMADGRVVVAENPPEPLLVQIGETKGDSPVFARASLRLGQSPFCSGRSP